MKAIATAFDKCCVAHGAVVNVVVGVEADVDVVSPTCDGEDLLPSFEHPLEIANKTVKR